MNVGSRFFLYITLPCSGRNCDCVYLLRRCTKGGDDWRLVEDEIENGSKIEEMFYFGTRVGTAKRTSF